MEKKRKDDLILEVDNDCFVLILGALDKLRMGFIQDHSEILIEMANATQMKFLNASHVNGKRVVVLKGDEERNYVCNAIYDIRKPYAVSDKKEDIIMSNRYAEAYNAVRMVPTKREYHKARKAQMRNARREHEVR